MTQTAKIYGDALYDLTRDEGLSEAMLPELDAIQEIFEQSPAYPRLLSSAALSKEERCGLIDQAFRGKIQPYLLNFLKILCEKGHLKQLAGCRDEFRQRYNQDHGILEVRAVAAAALTPALREKLIKKLEQTTGKQIDLRVNVDERVLGGLRLEYDGQQLDGTVKNRLDQLRKQLNDTVL